MIVSIQRILMRQSFGVALGVTLFTAAVPAATAQVIYHDGGTHLLDENHAPPNGDLMQGVLVQNDSTVTIRDINTNGQPTVGGIGYTLTRDFGDVFDLVVATTDTSTANIQGGTFSAGVFDDDMKLIAFDDSMLSVHGGQFNATELNFASAISNSRIHVAGGRFVSSSNLFRSEGNAAFLVTGGEFVTQGSNNNNLWISTGQSTFTVAGGSLRPAAHNGVRLFGDSTFNIHDGSFLTPNGQNSVLAQNNSTVNINGGVFDATGGQFDLIPQYFQAQDEGVFNLTGGAFTGQTLLYATHHGVMNVQGGALPSDSLLWLGEGFSDNAFFDNENPQIHLHGSQFAIDGAPIDFSNSENFVLFNFNGTQDTVGLLNGSDLLTGTLADGSPFTLTIDTFLNDRDTSGQIVLHIPEPTPITLLCLFWATAGLWPCRKGQQAHLRV